MGYFRENIERAAGYQPGFQPFDFAQDKPFASLEDRPAETDVVKLNTNENPYPPSPAVMDAIRNTSEEQMRRYPDPHGNKFRKAAS